MLLFFLEQAAFTFGVFFAGVGSPGLYYNSMEFFFYKTNNVLFGNRMDFLLGGGPITSVEGQASFQSLDLHFKWKTS